MKLHYRIATRIINFVWRLFFGFKVYGGENIPDRGGVIIAPNHLSNYDPPLVGTAIWTREVFFFAKKDLFVINPFYSWLIKAFNAYEVNIKGIDKQAIRHTEKLLQRGLCVIMFPEGTRSKKNILLDARPGLGFIAARVGVNIIPVYIQGTNYPLISQFLGKTRAIVIFGEAINPSLFAGKIRERAEAISDEVMRRIKELSEDERVLKSA